MAIGTITTPSPWVLGTVATPTWFQNAQDTLNASYGSSLGGDYFSFEDDFEQGQIVATTNGIQVSKFVTSGITGASIATDFASSPAGTFGMMSLSNSGGGTAAATALSSRLGVGALDFVFRCRVNILDKSKLDTVANKGFIIYVNHDGSGKGAGWYAGNNNANFHALNTDGTTTALSASITNNTFYVLEIVRAGGNLTYYVDGVSKRQYADATALTFADIHIQLVGLAYASSSPYVHIDYVKFYCTRTYY